MLITEQELVAGVITLIPEIGVFLPPSLVVIQLMSMVIVLIGDFFICGVTNTSRYKQQLQKIILLPQPNKKTMETRLFTRPAYLQMQELMFILLVLIFLQHLMLLMF